MSHSYSLAPLRASGPVVLPSLLLCDFGHLEHELRAVEEAGARALHLDIMDGHFVPNITYGFTILEAVRRLSELPLDVHLMITNPEKYVRQFVDAGANLVSVHIEASPDPRSVLAEIQSQGAAAGLVLNPPTPLSAIEPYLGACDFVLAMTVMPGYGGQKFDASVLGKIRELREKLPAEALIEVDGGVAPDTIADCAQAGAELFVAGSAIFRTPDYRASLEQLEQLATR